MRYPSAFAVLLIGLASLPTEAAVTYTFDSEGFAAVGNGESGTFTDADGEWTVRGYGNLSTIGLFRGMQFFFDQDDPPPEVDPGWTLQFVNDESAELEVGHYTNLDRWAGTGAFMRISNDITCDGDDDPENSFTVTEIEYDLYGRPIRFVGSFVLRCTPGGGSAHR